MSNTIALFGGTFNPIHNGHLGAVAEVSAVLGLGQIRWMLSARPPHKGEPAVSVEQRFTMLELALAEYPDWIADDFEIKRATKSYTFDTLKALAASYPQARLAILIGGDSLHTLHKWYAYPTLLDQAVWVVMQRPGFALTMPDELKSRAISQGDFADAKHGAIYLHHGREFDVSSTRIRAAFNSGKELDWVQEQLPSAVFNYINEQQLYKIGSMNSEQIKNEVVAAVEDIKGQDIRVIDIAEVSDFADYMVVVSGTSDTHVKSMAREASDRLRKLGQKPLNEDGADIGEWVLVDFGDVVLHVMRPEVRAYYDLEKLWDEDVRAMLSQHRDQLDD